MTLLKCKKGHTLIDIAVVMTLLATAVSTAGPLTRRVIAHYQLNTAAHVLTADLVRARVGAIKANAVTSFYRTSDRYYRASGHPRQLPRMVRFTDASADSLAFNGLGALHSFGAFNSFGALHSLGALHCFGSLHCLCTRASKKQSNNQ